MNIRKLITGILIAVTLLTGVSADSHWVNDELAAFKQLMLPVIKSDTVSQEDKNIIESYIFNELKLDQPILIDHWALLLGEVFGLPKEKSDQLLGMYAYGLSTGNEIKREDAVGGLVKLLTIEHMSGQSSADELKPAEVLTDIDSISERQSILVRMAYREGILDATVKNAFRPKESLTVSEAVSMLYRVMRKYNIDLYESSAKKNMDNPQQHWAYKELEAAIRNVNEKAERIEGIKKILQTEGMDSSITIHKWNDLLSFALNLGNTKYDKSFLESYTYGLTKDKYITRASAVAGMMKLMHAAELVDWRDATEEEKASAAAYFTDFDKVWDQSKLSIAYAEGLITGYEDCSFRPEQRLTNGEAAALMVRIINKYY